MFREHQLVLQVVSLMHVLRSFGVDLLCGRYIEVIEMAITDLRGGIGVFFLKNVTAISQIGTQLSHSSCDGLVEADYPVGHQHRQAVGQDLEARLAVPAPSGLVQAPGLLTW